MKEQFSQENRDAMNQTARVFSENLRAELKKQGITQDDFALQAELSPGTIKNPLNNQTIPKLHTAVRIAKELGVSLDYLCGIGDIPEITCNKKSSAETLLKNLIQVIRDTDLKFSLHRDQDARTITTIISNNHFIYQFLSQITPKTTNTEIREIAKNFKNCAVLDDGKIVNVNDYEYYKFLEFADINEHPYDMPEEHISHIKDKLDVWEKEHGASPYIRERLSELGGYDYVNKKK